MTPEHISIIAQELQLKPGQIQAVSNLLAEGATIPFMARYRKEATGSLDEVQLTAVRDRLAQLAALDERRAAIVKSLEERELMTPELAEKIANAGTMTTLEDIYLPYRPKRRTRGMMAKERGLEPLATLVFAQDPAADPTAEAAAYVNPEHEVADAEAALAGARDIMAEWMVEDAELRAQMRGLFERDSVFVCRAITGQEEAGVKYKDYFDWSEPAVKAPSHRVLAMRRGEKEGFLFLKVEAPEEAALGLLRRRFVQNDSAAAAQVELALADGYKRLLAPSMENEIRALTKDAADLEAVKVFAANLRQLLLAAPLGQKRMLAIDPGFRTGCKVVCLDAQGGLLHHDLIHVMTERQLAEAAAKLKALAAQYGAEAVAVGNGTASRETEALCRSLELKIPVVMVSESGASVYSASEVARQEFGQLDVSVRGAVSIGRRLMDPLAELVKIDPKAIGVGQYQHDVDQTQLKRGLEDVVVSCVNAVGVEVNTASPQLLTHVSGLGKNLAQNIVAWRQANGPFASREDLKKVPRLGPKAFEQAAGFLRIRGGHNPLDASAVHPESYHIVERMAADLGRQVPDLLDDESLRLNIKAEKYVSDQVGLPTIKDILSELAKPGRDPREQFEAFSFAEGVHDIKDLEVGMKLPGVVTNVTNFGAFVDIGVHRDGLVHVSELSDQFVADPRQAVKVQDRVQVTVVEVDLVRERIGLSMKSDPFASPTRGGRADAGAETGERRPPRGDQGRRGGDRRGGGKGKGQAAPAKPAPVPFNNPFAALKGLGKKD